jgi:hypothetical protein
VAAREGERNGAARGAASCLRVAFLRGDCVSEQISFYTAFSVAGSFWDASLKCEFCAGAWNEEAVRPMRA